MRFRAKIEVTLKQGHTDPEGEATERLLSELGYSIDRVDVGKLYAVTFQAESPKAAKTAAETMSKRLLANPIKDNFSIIVEEKE